MSDPIRHTPSRFSPLRAAAADYGIENPDRAVYVCEPCGVFFSHGFAVDLDRWAVVHAAEHAANGET